MTPAQTSPETPNMLYPGCTLQAGNDGPAQTHHHLSSRLPVPAQPPWPRRTSTDLPVTRELCQPRTEANVETRHEEQPESSPVRANTRRYLQPIFGCLRRNRGRVFAAALTRYLQPVYAAEPADIGDLPRRQILGA
jgi:hypothetical protein